MNSPYSSLEALEENLPSSVKQRIASQNVEFYHIDASAIAQELGLGGHINMIMQVCLHFICTGKPPIPNVVLVFDCCSGYYLLIGMLFPVVRCFAD